MAKEKTDKKEKLKKDAQKTDGAGDKTGLLTWLILAAVVFAGATGGFALSQLVGGQDEAVTASRSKGKDAQSRKAFEDLLAEQAGTASWIYDINEPVLANLDEPGVTRYVRVTISLEMSPELDREKGKTFLDQRMLVLRDWLTTYFAGLSLEDVRGSRNLNRIKRDVLDHFNELLFANTKPYVHQVLFREFAVQ